MDNDKAVEINDRANVPASAATKNEMDGITESDDTLQNERLAPRELNGGEEKPPQRADITPDHDRRALAAADDLIIANADIDKFKPGYRFYLAFSSLAVLALMVSLDSTSVSVALPVRSPNTHSLNFPLPPWPAFQLTSRV